MSKKLNDYLANAKGIAETLVYCVKLSWNASKFYTVIRVLSQFVSSAVAIVFAYIGKNIVDILSSGHTDQTKALIIIFVLLLLVVTCVSRIFDKLKEYCLGIHNDMLTNTVIMDTMSKSLNADIKYYDSPAFYNTIQTVRNDSQSIIMIVWQALDGVGALVTLISAFIIISGVNLLFGVIMLAAVIPSAIVNMRYTKILYRWGLSHINEQRQMNYLSYVASNRAHVMDVRLFHIADFLKDRYSKIWRNYFFNRKKVLKRQSILTTGLSLLPDIVTGMILLSITLNIWSGKNQIGDYLLYSGLLSQLSGSVFRLMFSVNQLFEDQLKIKNVRSFETFSNHIQNTGKRILRDPVSIEFKNVSFRYPNAEQMTLKNVSFQVRANEKVCIVGVNGAGKSTIMKLLLRFYDVTEGEILLNGFRVQDYEINALRRQFSSFFQDVNNYSLTLRENIILSDIDSYNDDSDVLDALKKSGGEGLAKDSEGLDTYITKQFEKDGVELSGGQHQKLALARAFYRKASVLLLDEPSASLDPEAEYNLFKNLGEICQSKTTVFTSHRLSNVHLADRIVLLEDGEVKECGTHAELMDMAGRYEALYRYQAEKYVSKM